MAQVAIHPLRVDEHLLRARLDELDQAAQPPRGIDLRRDERHLYRAAHATIEFPRESAGRLRYATAPRNLSRRGIGLLMGRYVYAGTLCRVSLPGRYGDLEVVAGRAVRCHYVLGSGSLHEVGVRFDHPIDVALFADRARPIHVLLVDDDTVQHQLIGCLLEPHGARLTCVAQASEAVEAVAADELDMVLLDLESGHFDPFATTRQLREAGYLGPLIGLAVQTGRTLESQCAAAGCTGYLRKPVTDDGLRGLLESLISAPVVSAWTHEPRMAPLIDQFVVTLRQQMRSLARAFESGDAPTVLGIAREVRAAAASYGFEGITEEAEHLETLASLDSPRQRLREAVYALVQLGLAARAAACDTSPDCHDPARPSA